MFRQTNLKNDAHEVMKRLKEKDVFFYLKVNKGNELLIPDETDYYGKANLARWWSV